MKVFHHKSQKDIWKLFEEASEIGLDEQNPYLKLMPLEAFVGISLERDLFNPKM